MIKLRRAARPIKDAFYSCVVVATMFGLAAMHDCPASGADAERKPVAAKPEMRLIVGPAQLLILLSTALVQNELKFTPEQCQTFDDLRQRWRAWDVPFPKHGTDAEQQAYYEVRHKFKDETFVALERVLLPAQKARLDEIALQLYFPFAFYAGLSLELDEYLGLSDFQRQKVYRYADVNVNGGGQMYERGDADERVSWDYQRNQERIWTAALLVELTNEQRSRLKTLTGAEVKLALLQEQRWNACIAEAAASGKLVQEPSPELMARDPKTGDVKRETEQQLEERNSLLDKEDEPMPGKAPTLRPLQ